MNPGLLQCKQILYHLSHQGSHTKVIVKMLKFWQTSLGITRLETFDNDKLLEVTVQTTSSQVRGTRGDCRVVGTHCWTPRHRAPSTHLVRLLSSGPGPQEEKGSQGCLLRGWSRQVSPQHASWPRLGLIWGTGFAWKFHCRCPAGPTSDPESSEEFPPTKTHSSRVIFSQSDTLCAWRNFIYVFSHATAANTVKKHQ